MSVTLPLPTSPSETSFTYNAMLGTAISDDLIKSRAQLFSTNYGIWGEKAISISKYTKPGQSVKMTGSKLRSQCVSIPDHTVLVTCFQHEKLVGHAFASVWSFEGGVVGWITQLVVDMSVRKRYIATQLLQTLKVHPLFQGVTAVGLVSSHPAACSALAKYSDVGVYAVDLSFIRENAARILEASAVDYLKSVQLRGDLFQENAGTDAVSSMFTEFYVDHAEPSKVLEKFKVRGKWCLGELLEGHEYLALFPVSPLGD
ncbi:uncharacterized protein EDB91DRAFT_1152670 [Suillus paluster]|uniref:uncharacterized protein n=1 Tax=Suillus paluster TaxID=48578 RepID=UPI001B8620DB|nr:uncharacterized protein EDB91DRAFT_1152670 [Suillus paluster]KAG1731980.1 hypothetical protein EDB91DRAFT_1152670 [Suillus paluster]